ncbi:lipid A biosynthesis lauroyl acyltransferase [Bosea caraganae]|uniref:Lipid A biosynthesis lauroyl acyltransferase n=1 Tax=Bosea caraganae TaxID=2763117 RepID=A0A370L021_9HYPH|nr:lipid A biosynthesis lauroyl acyltransferase [Bosea caraganae]RDJ28440.1 lipid A biosynthesis lauroyl acyltransferase [Bosea caraganae]
MIGLIRALFGALRLLGRERSSDLGGWLLRSVSPLIPVNKVALANIRAVFPEKSEAEVKAIARGAWENLGRTAAEYAHLNTLFDYDYHNPGKPSRVEVAGIEHFIALKDDEKPGLIFSAHLGNWELPAICAAAYDLETTAVFRAPNDPAIASVVHEIRSGAMGGLAAAKQGAAFAMQGVLEKGGHLGMLIDQHFTRGVVVPFLGRPALTNPILGKFVRRFECPVHGVRVIRLPNQRFRLELTPPLDLPRDAAGEIDVAGAMAMMTAVVDGWVREHPEQWLWMHRRWRPNMIGSAALADYEKRGPVKPAFKAT